MATAVKIPYIVPPEIITVVLGSEENSTGTVEVIKKFELTFEEKAYIDSYSDLLPPPLYQFVFEYSKQVADSLGKPFNEVRDAVTERDFEYFKDSPETLFDYIEKIEKAARAREEVEKKIIASAIIKYRIVGSWAVEDIDNPEQITPALVSAIADFGFKERDGWVEEE